MQEVMAEVQRLGTTDPAGQQRLLEDLQTSDPAIWPLVVQQFHATEAYRRQHIDCSEAAAVQVQRLPAANDVKNASGETPQVMPQTLASPIVAAAPAADAAPSPVIQASYGASVQIDGRQQLAQAIKTLEAECPKNPISPAEIAQCARLRLLYAAVGRREDALQPIPSASPAEQEFLAKEIEGLTTWLSVEQMPEAARRAADAKPVLAAALGKLAEAAPLAVRNLAFCTEVLSYGCFKRFEKYEFQPNQEVLLYAEVENYASEPTPNGYHTSLKSSYQIYDSRGRRAAEHDFAPTEEYCQNLRRDFFIGYRLRLPKDLEPGKYTLRLSIDDTKCGKSGQATIEFTVVEAKQKS